ncbi:hypothetical protein BDZ89DRAFT_1075888 [Hymenopellis radicata]|nr:hypothetical protein BDZ89DRAFT_1075888 [Hymenopellis radicata]
MANPHSQLWRCIISSRVVKAGPRPADNEIRLTLPCPPRQLDLDKPGARTVRQHFLL